MSDLIKFYDGTVTKGGTDGDEISEGTNSKPLTFTLNAAENESACAKVAVRCKTGYSTYGDTRICAYHFNGKGYEPTGGSVNKWSFAMDNNYADANDALKSATWTDSITIKDAITDKNTVFWVKASSDSTEAPQNDISTALFCSAVIKAV